MTGSIHPGPPQLGRGVIVAPGGVVPAPWEACPRVPVTAATLSAPAETIEVLHHTWLHREPVVVELGVEPGVLREPERTDAAAWTLPSTFGFEREQLFFLVWANNYDARSGPPVWWWARKAERVGAQPGAKADITLPDGRPAWVDGGPRGPVGLDVAVVHRESIEIGRLTVSLDAAATAALAPDQLRAVAHGAGPARIVAPAGSGKTRVLTERLHHLVADRGVEPGLITAVAYNTRAAAELTERLRDGVRPEVRTLHSLGFEILRDHASHAGLRSPTLITERDVRDRLSDLVPVRPRANTDVMAPYLDGLSDIRLGLVEPARAEAERDDAPDLARVLDTYRTGLAAAREVDFDELIFGAVEVLLRDPDTRQRARSRRRHLLVDEFQDLTPAYLMLVRLLAAPANQVYGVGDDDQVIYGYAGATPRYLTTFDHWFPGASPYALEVNYRCAPPIVEAAANLLTRNRDRVPKSIRPGRPDGSATDGEAMTVVRAPAVETAPRVVEQVRSWIDAGRPPASIAVLCRVNSGLLATQILLGEAGIARTTAVDAGIQRRTGVRSALAYLRLATGDTWSGHDLAEVANRPSRKIARRLTEPLRRRRGWTEAQLADRAATLGGRDGERLGELVDDLVTLRDRSVDADTETILRLVRDVIGLGRAVDTLDRSRGGDVSSHADDLTALTAVATMHPDPRTFADWLDAALRRDGDVDGVHLSSIHRVKGLEWDAVAVVGVDAGQLPHRLSADIEEERRILHVAMTRARDHLYLATDIAAPSPFLAELAEPGEPPPVIEPVADHPRPVSSTPGLPGVDAEVGMAVGLSGGFTGIVSEIESGGVVVALDGGGVTRLRFGDQVTVDGRLGAIAPPAPDDDVLDALRAWRSERAKADAVPAYVVFSNEHLLDIARRHPSNLDELGRCKGVGPTRLERYGDDVLDVLDRLA